MKILPLTYDSCVLPFDVPESRYSRTTTSPGAEVYSCREETGVSGTSSGGFVGDLVDWNLSEVTGKGCSEGFTDLLWGQNRGFSIKALKCGSLHVLDDPRPSGRIFCITDGTLSPWGTVSGGRFSDLYRVLGFLVCRVSFRVKVGLGWKGVHVWGVLNVWTPPRHRTWVCLVFRLGRVPRGQIDPGNSRNVIKMCRVHTRGHTPTYVYTYTHK